LVSIYSLRLPYLCYSFSIYICIFSAGLSIFRFQLRNSAEEKEMGATSVTGKGRGSADGSNKGSTHMTIGASHLVGPRVVAAGSIDLVDGAATIKLPAPAGVATDYVVLATDVDAAQAVGASLAFSAALTDGTKDAVITLAGNTTNTIAWSVVKTGVAI
jgi:hypothetical protein